jgi:hypothetical protein
VSAQATLDPDAAMALGIASTAMPFARTPGEEAERWLRVLRMQGEVGVVLQALGVSEGPLETPGESAPRKPDPSGEGSGPAQGEADSPSGGTDSPGVEGADSHPGGGTDSPGVDGADSTGVEARDPIAQVTSRAVQIAGRRGAAGVATTDLLLAVMGVYGEDFDRVLRVHGTDRDEVLERLGATMD